MQGRPVIAGCAPPVGLHSQLVKFRILRTGAGARREGRPYWRQLATPSACCHGQQARDGTTKLQDISLAVVTAALASSVLAGAAIGADIQTLTPSQAVASARALPERVVKKGKVWLLLAGGAAALFGATIVIENNANFFPAIARANLAMRTNRNKQGSAAGLATATMEDSKADARLLDAVSQGLASASARSQKSDEVDPAASHEHRRVQQQQSDDR